MIKILYAGLVLTAALSLPALAQNKRAQDEGHKKGAVELEKTAELDMRLKFDEKGAKGEVDCKEGTYKDGKVEYKKLIQDKLDKYDSVAIEKQIVTKENYDKFNPKKKRLAKKLAFLHSAHAAAKARVKEIKEKGKDDMAAAKSVGAQGKIDQEYDKALSECAKEDSAVFNCPKKDND